MKEISFIHTADLHLDSPFVGLQNLPKKIFDQIRESTFKAFTNIVNLAIEKQVDFVMIAGDIYDGEDRSVRAQIYFRNEMERLEQAGIPIIVSHGNHDHLSGNWIHLDMPQAVHVFPGMPQMQPLRTKSGALIHIYGFSYQNKHVFERMIEKYKKVDGADFHIGMLHGHDSRNKEHYSYAPFKLEDLLEKEFHYWALGHIHKTSILNRDPYVIYPGNIQGRHRNETGSKGCFYIKMNHYETQTEFVEAAPIIWEKKTVHPEVPLQSFGDIYDTFINMKEGFRREGSSVFLELVINESKIEPSLFNMLDTEELLQLLQEGEEVREEFVWVYNIRLQADDSKVEQPVDESFLSELIEVVNSLDDLDTPLSSLFDKSNTKKYIDALTAKEQEEIKIEAQRLLNLFLRL